MERTRKINEIEFIIAGFGHFSHTHSRAHSRCWSSSAHCFSLILVRAIQMPARNWPFRQRQSSSRRPKPILCVTLTMMITVCRSSLWSLSCVCVDDSTLFRWSLGTEKNQLVEQSMFRVDANEDIFRKWISVNTTLAPTSSRDSRNFGPDHYTHSKLSARFKNGGFYSWAVSRCSRVWSHCVDLSNSPK